MITVEHLANLVISACEAIQAPYMLTGALAYNYYAIPRSTMDVDIVVNITEPGTMARIIGILEPAILFVPEVEFDTTPWGRRHSGRPSEDTGLSVELFELFEDPFVAVQDPESLDITYIENWCSIHGTTEPLESILANLPPQ